MSRVSFVRFLDSLTVVLLALLVGVLLTGGWSIPLGQWQVPITRPENVLLAILPVLALRWRLRFPALPAIGARPLVALGVLAYALVFSFITVTRHYAFRTHALDLGQYVQIIWNITQGYGAYTSMPEMHAWGDHLSPIFYLFVPLFLLVPGSVPVLVIQTASLAAGAVAVFAIARRPLGDDRLAAGFAGLYLLNPSLHGVNLRDFHPAVLAIPLLLAAVAWFDANRPIPFLLALLLTLSTREDAALPVIGFGLWALGQRRWAWGAGLSVMGLGWLLLATGWVMPFFRGAPYPHLQRFAHLGGSVGEIVLNLASHPLATLAHMATGDRLLYLAALLAPLAFLPLLSPRDLLPALPALLVNLQSRDPVLFHHRSQYTAFVLPFLVLAAVSGYRCLMRWSAGRARGSPLLLMPRAALALAVLLSLALGARTVNDLGVDKWRLSGRQRAAYAVMALIPAGATVSAQERYVPHLALRPTVFIFPTGLDRSEYVLLDGLTYPWRDLPDYALDRQGEMVVIRAGASEHRFAVVAEQVGYLLLRPAP
ncbi:MAG: DUF2079 domain-containing protein [Candidatus Rokubacteria bacterium]|nr:DUF2079 domain-containing protein [Candidatus Rokubacteria bacterium]